MVQKMKMHEMHKSKAHKYQYCIKKAFYLCLKEGKIKISIHLIEKKKGLC